MCVMNVFMYLKVCMHVSLCMQVCELCEYCEFEYMCVRVHVRFMWVYICVFVYEWGEGVYIVCVSAFILSEQYESLPVLGTCIAA